MLIISRFRLVEENAVEVFHHYGFHLSSSFWTQNLKSFQGNNNVVTLPFPFHLVMPLANLQFKDSFPSWPLPDPLPSKNTTGTWKKENFYHRIHSVPFYVSCLRRCPSLSLRGHSSRNLKYVALNAVNMNAIELHSLVRRERSRNEPLASNISKPSVVLWIVKTTKNCNNSKLYTGWVGTDLIHWGKYQTLLPSCLKCR